MSVKTDGDELATGTGLPVFQGRDPKAGKKSAGNKAVNDAVIVVLIAWAVLGFLAYSLRHHNV